MHPVGIVFFSLELTDVQIDFPHFRVANVQNTGKNVVTCTLCLHSHHTGITTVREYHTDSLTSAFTCRSALSDYYKTEDKDLNETYEMKLRKDRT